MVELTSPQIRRLMENHPGIIWSNPDPPAAAVVDHFILSARFSPIWGLAKEIGIEAVTSEWDRIRSTRPLNRKAVVYTTLIIEALNETLRPVATRG